MSQVDSIFIFCRHKQHHEQWPEIKGVFTNINLICHALQQSPDDCEHNITPFILDRLKNLFETHKKLKDEKAKNEEEEIGKFINVNRHGVGKDKWSCSLSGKKFKEPEFVRKHILNKHQDKLDEVKKKEVVYFNPYLYDLKRLQLSEHPSGLPLPTLMGGLQPLLARPPLRPSIPGGGPPHHPPNNRPLRSYEDLDAPNEI